MNKNSTFKLWGDVYDRMEQQANLRQLKLSRLVNLALTEWLSEQPNLGTHEAFGGETSENRTTN